MFEDDICRAADLGNVPFSFTEYGILDGYSVFQTKTFYLSSPCLEPRAGCKAPAQLNVCGNVCALYVNGITTRTITNFTELVDSDGLRTIGEYLPVE